MRVVKQKLRIARKCSEIAVLWRYVLNLNLEFSFFLDDLSQFLSLILAPMITHFYLPFNGDVKADLIANEFHVVFIFYKSIPFVEWIFNHLVKCLMMKAHWNVEQQHHTNCKYMPSATKHNESAFTEIADWCVLIPRQTERNCSIYFKYFWGGNFSLELGLFTPA